MTTLEFPFTSATAEEHMKALKDYYPDARSADSLNISDDPDGNYCVGGGVCRYLLGEITNWEIDDALWETQDVILKAFHPEDEATYHDIRFPNHETVGEALNYISYKYFGDRVYRRIEAENSSDNEDRIAQRIQGFFNWLASGVTHFNDIEQIGHSWDWVNTVFDQELLDMRLEQYIAELNGSASHIYRTEDW